MGSKISTLKEINTDWNNHTMESLFKDDEKIEIIKSVFGINLYDKSKFNNAIQQLYIDKTKINLSDETKNNFKKIFEFIRGSL